MSSPLEHIDAKLQRTGEHINQLNVEVEALLDSAPYRSIPHGDPQALEDFERMLSKIRVPPRISVLAGEAIHQTRSALDHIASALVLVNNHQTTRETQFPIYKYRPSYENESLRYEGHTRGMSWSAKALIDGLQPFKVGSAWESHPLSILKALDNFNKHHALLVTVGASWPFVIYDRAGARFTESPDDPAVFVPIRLQMNVQRTFAAYVVFPKFGPAKNQPVVQSISELWGYVVFGLSRKFAIELTTVAADHGPAGA
jgi:hypothetical protein